MVGESRPREARPEDSSIYRSEGFPLRDILSLGTLGSGSGSFPNLLFFFFLSLAFRSDL